MTLLFLLLLLLLLLLGSFQEREFFLIHPKLYPNYTLHPIVNSTIILERKIKFMV